MSATKLAQRIGPYHIVRLLGSGTTGRVFEAFQANIGRRVAIKILKPASRLDPEIAQRFLTEARAGNRVHHPGLLEVYELGQHSAASRYIVMEYLLGETLQARLKRRPRLDLEGVRFARQIAAAMAAAHRGGVIHRDLKPGNVMIIPDPECPGGERIKVIDFGLAKLAPTQDAPEPADYLTLPGMIMGTPAYMAPEQCRGSGAISDRVDVYALGTMLYMMVSGRPPIPTRPNDDMATLLAAQIHRPPLPLADLAPDVPPELPPFVHRMLAKTPAERPSMIETVAFLDSVLEQRTVPVVLPSSEDLAKLLEPSITVVQAPLLAPPTPPPPAPRRSRLQAGAIAAALLLGGVPGAGLGLRVAAGYGPTLALVSDPPQVETGPRLVVPIEWPSLPPDRPTDTPPPPPPPAPAPEVAQAFLTRGLQALKEERWADAEELLHRACRAQESPKTVTAWALALFHIGRYQQARQTALRALHLHPSAEEVISARSTLWLVSTKLPRLPPVRS